MASRLQIISVTASGATPTLGLGLAAVAPGTTGQSVSFNGILVDGSGAAISVTAPQILPFTVDPMTQNAEVIWITALTAGQTSGLCTRGAEPNGQTATTAPAHVTGATMIFGPTPADVVSTGGGSGNEPATYMHSSANGVGTSGGDQTAAFKAFFIAANAAGAIALVDPGVYNSTWFYCSFAPRIEAIPGTVVINNTGLQDGWNFGGNFGEPCPPTSTSVITSNLTAGTFVIPCASTAGIVANQIIGIGDSTVQVSGPGTVATAGAIGSQLNLYRVESVNSSTQLTLAEGLIFPITSAGGTVQLFTFYSNGSVRGINFNNTAGATATNNGLRFYCIEDLEVTDCETMNMGQWGLEVNNCYKFRTKTKHSQHYDVNVTGIAGQYGYGIDVTGASAHGKIDIVADQCRHSCSFNGTGHDIEVRAVATACTSGGIDAHAGFSNIVFMNPMVDGQGPLVSGVGSPGVLMRGQGYRIVGGNIRNTSSGIDFIDRPSDCVVHGTTIENTTGAAVLIGQIWSGAKGFDLQGLNIKNCGGPAFSDAGQVSTTISDFVFMNSRILNVCTAGAGAAFQLTTANTRGRFVYNVIDDNQGSPTTTAIISATVAQSDVQQDFNSGNVQLQVTGAAGYSIYNSSGQTLYTDTETTSLTLLPIHAGGVVEGNSASAMTITIPTNATTPFLVGTYIEVFQLGAGQITIAAAGGVTLLSDGALVHTAAQYATVALRQRAANIWVLSGDLA